MTLIQLPLSFIEQVIEMTAVDLVVTRPDVELSKMFAKRRLWQREQIFSGQLIQTGLSPTPDEGIGLTGPSLTKCKTYWRIPDNTNMQTTNSSRHTANRVHKSLKNQLCSLNILQWYYSLKSGIQQSIYIQNHNFCKLC